MKKIINDFNIKKQANDLGVSIWQAPSFLFLLMGIITVVVMTAVYFISRNNSSPEVLIISETLVVVLIFFFGGIIIKNVEKIARINKTKTEFISIASHQLKSPLSKINWGTELILGRYREGLNEKQIEMIEKIRKVNDKMTNLVNDFLDVSRIDQGELFVKKEEINLKNILDEVLAEKNELIEAKNIQLNVNCPIKKITVIGDLEKIKIVLNNLIANAIYYNKENGQVIIDIKKKDTNIIFCIKDSGIGIAKEDQFMVFEKFFRTQKAISTRANGTGLGLYIAKNIIEQCGGEVWFESEKGVGSIFCFSVPMG